MSTTRRGNHFDFGDIYEAIDYIVFCVYSLFFKRLWSSSIIGPIRIKLSLFFFDRSRNIAASSSTWSQLL